MFLSDRGHVAKPVHMALGTLIIQARWGYTGYSAAAARWAAPSKGVFSLRIT